MGQILPKGPDGFFNEEDAAEKLCILEHISNTYYASTTRIGVHSFIEHTGLMREHLKLLRMALQAGINPEHLNGHGSEHVEMPSFSALYIGEKFACIFAPFFTPETFEVFVESVRKEIRPRDALEREEPR